MFDLTGKSAAVTGGSRGIGRAIARRLRDAGSRVAVLDLEPPVGDAAIAGAAFHRADVSDEASFAEALDAWVEDAGPLDVLVNNAAIQPLGPTLADTTAELIEQTFAVNLQGVLHGLKLAPPRMPATGGRVGNVGSFVALRAAPKVSAYGLSKNAVLYATRVAALELAARRITVNCVCPGTVNTPAVTGIPDNPEVAWLERVCPMRRLAEPEEVAAAVHFLASDDARYVTGQALAVDGGATAGWAEHDVVPPAELVDGRWDAAAANGGGR